MPGVEETFSEWNCGLRPGYPHAGYVSFAFDAVAGSTYQVHGATVAVHNADAEHVDLDSAQDRFRFLETGRSYMALWPPMPFTITIEDVIGL